MINSNVWIIQSSNFTQPGVIRKIYSGRAPRAACPSRERTVLRRLRFLFGKNYASSIMFYYWWS